MTCLSSWTDAERGRQAQIARECGVRSATVHAWVRAEKPVPVRFCAVIEQTTAGAVTRQDLRPDDWHLIWPELAEQEAADA